MTNKTDGGPAFPVENGPETGYAPGMSLRDYFAGQALAGMCSRLVKGTKVDPIVQDAYNFADAMIAEREREK